MASAYLRKVRGVPQWYAKFPHPVTGVVKNVRLNDSELRPIAADKVKAEKVAERAAAEFIAGVAGVSAGCESLRWDTFCLSVEETFLADKSSPAPYRTAMMRITKSLRFTYLKELTPAMIKTAAARWSKEVALSTVNSYLKHLRAVLNWAVTMKYIQSCPTIKLMKDDREDEARSRAVTASEFGKLLRHTAAVVGADVADDWTFLLRGLYASGLRLSEALKLSWNPGTKIWIDRDDPEQWFVHFPASQHKARRLCIVPVVPEFRAVLEQTPEDARSGRVFNPRGMRTAGSLGTTYVGSVIRKIGTSAGIVTREYERGHYDGTDKHASAHDLRRSFGFAWANRVPAQDLKELMRHTDIAVTMAYYLGQRAASVGANTAQFGLTKDAKKLLGVT